MADTVALRQVFLEVRHSPTPESVITPLQFTNIYLNINRIGSTNGRNLGTFEQSNTLSDIGDFTS